MNKSNAVRDIVVIGASLGGVAALRRIVFALPANFAAAVLVVLHQSANAPRLMDEVLGDRALLNVSYAREDDAIKHSHVYLAPPDHHLVVRGDLRLGLEHTAKVRHSRPAVDVLFISAAEVFRDRVIGIVLTGGDHDGTDGMKAIAATGGIRIVQSPSEAVDPGMPSSVIAGDHPQFIAMLDEIPTLLVSLVQPGVDVH